MSKAKKDLIKFSEFMSNCVKIRIIMKRQPTVNICGVPGLKAKIL